MFHATSTLKTILVKVIVCGSFLLFAHAAFGCLCAGDSQKEAFNRARKGATAIFEGRVVEVQNGMTQGEFPGWRVKLAVDRYWKGTVKREMVLFTGPDNCAVYFEVGRQYVVFAYVPLDESQLHTNVCMQTRLVRYAAANLKRLGRGKRFG